VLVALGSPKGEYLLAEQSQAYAPALGLSIGASLDFVAGKVERAPQWWSEHGLEWLFRLWKEPRRLWRRYLVRDRAILGIFIRDLRKRTSA
jgi:N-acetylglucosaminyldiphosphoundecaprenol N-acetyl-beta-D-mannosaminyltransferase